MRCILAAICLLPTALFSSASAAPAIGWVGHFDDFTGTNCQITDIWTARGSWSDLGQVGWPNYTPDFLAVIAANPNGAVNYATALIPHDQPSSTWNALLDQVISGQEDAVFTQEGQMMAKYSPATVYCRPWWEMTEYGTNKLDPARFIAAWNRAVPLIRAAFAATAPTKTLKITFCYLPNVGPSPATYYPGDATVDVIDADVYASVWGSTTPSLNTVLSQVQSNLAGLASFAGAHGKPIGISEWGNFGVQTQGVTCSQGRGDVPEYIDAMFHFAQQNNVLYMVYFNLAGGGVGQTMADTPLSLAAFKLDDSALQPPASVPAPVAPAPVTSDPVPLTPVTSDPVSPAPVTSDPVTPAPVTPAPVSPAPVTSDPVSPTPVTSDPVAPAPVTSDPVSPAPVTSDPVSPVPVTSDPVSPVPVTSDPAPPAPVTSDPVPPAPVTPAPVSPAPVSSDPVAPAPVTSSPGSSVPPQPATTGFAAWQAKYFSAAQLADNSISGPTSDPYATGLPNLMAYALQLDPSTAQPSDEPVATPSNGHLVMTYFVPSALTDIVLTPEASTDLVNWTSGPEATTRVSSVGASGGSTLTVADLLPTSSKKHYMRLRVTQVTAQPSSN